MFMLTEQEKQEVVANCDHLSRLKYSRYLPYAFTEHGAIMAATVLNTSRAVGVSIYVVRAFVLRVEFNPGRAVKVLAGRQSWAFEIKRKIGTCFYVPVRISACIQTSK